jgi:hypothetical protein
LPFPHIGQGREAPSVGCETAVGHCVERRVDYAETLAKYALFYVCPVSADHRAYVLSPSKIRRGTLLVRNAEAASSSLAPSTRFVSKRQRPLPLLPYGVLIHRSQYVS